VERILPVQREPTSRKRIRHLLTRLTMPLMVCPALVLMAVFYVWPFVGLLRRSLFDPELTLDNYRTALTNPAAAIYFRNTLDISIWVVVLAILLGYPVAYLLNSVKPRVANLLRILVILPFFTSFLIRTYALTLVLGRRSVVNTFLLQSGLISQPLKILYTRSAVLLGLLQTLVPLMVLPLYAVMRGIDKDLINAARNLGASSLQAFLRIFFPLSLPGVAAGGILVFITSMGAYLTARLLGGPGDQMLANFIENQIMKGANFSLASAEAMILLIVTLITFFVSQRLLKINLITGW